MRHNWKTTKQPTGRLLIRTTYTLSVADNLSSNGTQHKQLTHNCNPTIKCYWSVPVWSPVKAKENWPELQQVSYNLHRNCYSYLLLLRVISKLFIIFRWIVFCFHSYFKISNKFDKLISWKAKRKQAYSLSSARYIKNALLKWYTSINKSSI